LGREGRCQGKGTAMSYEIWVSNGQAWRKTMSLKGWGSGPRGKREKGSGKGRGEEKVRAALDRRETPTEGVGGSTTLGRGGDISTPGAEH